MTDINLILSIPQGIITASSLGIPGLARHYSPGSGRHFKDRKIFVDLAIRDLRPDFEFLDDGGWRDADTDSVNALAAAASGNRTKTALSNNAFSCTPISAYNRIYLVKTGGDVMPMEPGELLHRFVSGECHEEMSPAEVAGAAGIPNETERVPRIYLVMCPIQILLVSNLTPVEYAWYATHRPGKVFRHVIFSELQSEQPGLAALSRYRDARMEIEADPDKKTKTVVSEDCINEVPFHSWLGYPPDTEGGLYVANQEEIDIYRFPAEIPSAWERASG